MHFQLSVVIPVFNAAKSIENLILEINQHLKSISFEIILINDASKDNSAEICKKLTTVYPNIKYIGLRKNFGEFNAVICGLNYVQGDFTVIIDDDFQNPPSEINKLLEKIALKSP